MARHAWVWSAGQGVSIRRRRVDLQVQAVPAFVQRHRLLGPLRLSNGTDTEQHDHRSRWTSARDENTGAGQRLPEEPRASLRLPHHAMLLKRIAMA